MARRSCSSVKARATVNVPAMPGESEIALPEVVIELRRAGGTNPLKYMEFKLKEVLISGVIGAGDPAGPSGFPTETIKMTYGAIEWTYTKQKPDGSPAGNVSTKWSLARTPGARSGRRVR